MKKNKIAILAVIVLFVGAIIFSCSFAPIKGNTLNFTNRVSQMQKLDGREVNITGYMSAFETDKDYYFYLSDSPYNKKPFSEDNSKKLSDTVAVYAKSGESFEYTDNLITVTGTLQFGEFTDGMGYTYSYRIKNASFAPASEDNLSKKELKWQKLCQAGIIERTDAMMRYVEFVCSWPTLTISQSDEDTYLTPALTLYNLEGSSSVFNYGNEEGYFDKIIEDINAISSKDYSELVKIIEEAEALSEKAIAALENREYSLQEEYSGIFNDGRKQYILNNSEEITAGITSIKEDYNKWLNNWAV